MDAAEYEKKRQAILGNKLSKPIDTAPTCTCGLQMVKRLGNGEFWCPLCEVTAKDIQEHAKHSNIQNSQARRDAVRANILADPLYGFAIRLTEKILQEHGYEHNVIFRNIRNADHQKLSNGVHQVRFGYELINNIAKNGYREYQSYSYLWSEHSDLTGKKAVWAVIIHETAHAVQTGQGHRWYGSAHNSYWANAVEELQILYPFEEVQDT